MTTSERQLWTARVKLALWPAAVSGSPSTRGSESLLTEEETLVWPGADHAANLGNSLSKPQALCQTLRSSFFFDVQFDVGVPPLIQSASKLVWQHSPEMLSQLSPPDHRGREQIFAEPSSSTKVKTISHVEQIIRAELKKPGT